MLYFVRKGLIDMKLTRKEYSRLARCVVGALVFMGGGQQLVCQWQRRRK